ncbi:hypothetical protein P7K49_001643, partial [Saguinus oedipus]
MNDKQQGLEQKMLLVLPKWYSVYQTLQLASSDPWQGDVDGVREGKGLQWIEEACKEFRSQDVGFIRGQLVISWSHHLASLRVPQSIITQLGGLTSR